MEQASQELKETGKVRSKQMTNYNSLARTHEKEENGTRRNSHKNMITPTKLNTARRLVS